MSEGGRHFEVGSRPPTSLSGGRRFSSIFSRLKMVIRKHWILFSVFFLGLIFFSWFVPFIPALYFQSIKVTRLDAKGLPIQVEVGPGTKNWTPLDKISRHLVNAVIVAEDGKFYEHQGFDFEAIRKAVELNKKKGRYARGASTISQQVVKMAFLTREKTITRKLREAVGTALMELILSKKRILEWYLNLCEFGGGIYGIRQAGMYYFKTRPELLTIEQATHLALVIPSPNKWSKGLRAKKLTPFGQKRFGRIVTNLFLAGYITESQKVLTLTRGNFGAPIAGFSPQDEDDCGSDKECIEALGDGGGIAGGTPPQNASLPPLNTPLSASLPPAATKEKPPAFVAPVEKSEVKSIGGTTTP